MGTGDIYPGIAAAVVMRPSGSQLPADKIAIIRGADIAAGQRAVAVDGTERGIADIKRAADAAEIESRTDTKIARWQIYACQHAAGAGAREIHIAILRAFAIGAECFRPCHGVIAYGKARSSGRGIVDRRRGILGAAIDRYAAAQQGDLLALRDDVAGIIQRLRDGLRGGGELGIGNDCQVASALNHMRAGGKGTL